MCAPPTCAFSAHLCRKFDTGGRYHEICHFLYYAVTFSTSPCGQGLEYAYRFPACRMRRLKVCPDGSAFTAWDYALLLCYLYSIGWRDRYSQYSWALPLFSSLSCPIPTQPLLHIVQHVAVVSIPLLLPSNSSILSLQLPLFGGKVEGKYGKLRQS